MYGSNLSAKKFVNKTNLACEVQKNFGVTPPTAQKFMPFFELKKANHFDASFAQYTIFGKMKNWKIKHALLYNVQGRI